MLFRSEVIREYDLIVGLDVIHFKVTTEEQMVQRPSRPPGRECLFRQRLGEMPLLDQVELGVLRDVEITAQQCGLVGLGQNMGDVLDLWGA